MGDTEEGMLSRRAIVASLGAGLMAGCGERLGYSSGAGADEKAGIIWDRRYKGALLTRFLDIVPASTGGVLLVGFTTSNTGNMISTAPGGGFAIRTDDEGREQWRHTVSGASALLAATQGADGEFVAATYRASGSGPTGDSGAVALSDDGTERWRTPLSQSGQSQLGSVVQASDGSYALGGVDHNSGWLVRLESDGSVRANRPGESELERVSVGGPLAWPPARGE